MIFPKRDEKDALYNRRSLTWLSFYYNILWALLVLVLDVNHGNLDAAKVTAYLAVPAGIFAIFSIGYVKAAKEDDKKDEKPQSFSDNNSPDFIADSGKGVLDESI